jgi:nitrate/nitrite transporter NarK
MSATPQDLSVPRLPVLAVLLPFALVFALCNYYRTVNAVLAPYLISALNLTAGQLGLLISIYFLVSALFQAPLGLLMDRFGPRRVQAVLILIAGIGAIIFALGESWPVLLTGRIILGIGAAGGLMTSLQAVTLWFPSARWPFFNGIVLSVGALGSLAATLPTQLILDVIDWHRVLVGAGIIGFCGSLLLFAFVPEKTKPPKGETLGQQLAGMAAIYRDRLFWRYAPLYLVTTGSTMAFQSLWAGPWLHDVARLDANAVALHLLVLSLLQIGSYFLIGFIATELGKRRVPLQRIVMTGSVIYIASLTPLMLPTGAGRWSVLLGIGLLSNVNTLCYPILSQHFPAAMTGRATTALNSFFFVGAFFVQLAVGIVIDLVPATEAGHYPTLAYQLAFAVMIGLQLSAWAWLLVKPRASIAPAGMPLTRQP